MKVGEKSFIVSNSKQAETNFHHLSFSLLNVNKNYKNVLNEKSLINSRAVLKSFFSSNGLWGKFAYCATKVKFEWNSHKLPNFERFNWKLNQDLFFRLKVFNKFHSDISSKLSHTLFQRQDFFSLLKHFKYDFQILPCRRRNFETIFFSTLDFGINFQSLKWKLSHFSLNENNSKYAWKLFID